MKLAEAEQEILAKGLTEEWLQAYATCLQRVRKRLSCQHCSALAFKLFEHDKKGAVRLIDYGLEHYATTWFERWNTYCTEGGIAEELGEYAIAKQSYLCAMAALAKAPHKDVYTRNLFVKLVRVELHRTAFSYSQDLEHFWQGAQTTDAFEEGIREDSLYRLVAKTIVDQKHGNIADLERAKAALQDVLDETEPTEIDKIFSRHRASNTPNATPQTVDYLRKLYSTPEP